MPGTVLAIAIIIVFLPPLPLLNVSLYGTIGIILVAYLARFLALALRPTVAGMELVSRNLDEAAQVAGAGVITRLRAIILPAVAPSAAAGALLVFMTAFNELTVSVLLWSTGRETLGVAVFFLHYEGNSPAAAAVATISIVVTLALAFLTSLLGAQPARRSGAVAGVTFDGVSKHFGATRAVEQREPRHHRRRILRAARAVGLRQDHACCGWWRASRCPTSGDVKLGDQIVGRPGWALPPEKRRIGMVFQSYALWPHMSVAENVAFALRVRKVPEEERVRRVSEALAMVGLDAMAERRPHELSGGQRQRVALARCLAMRPDVVLLDEPLANLDVHLREAMQQEFARFHKEIGATFIYVTHDQAEALALADRVAVMDAGRVEQAASPRLLYAEPATEMVARFVGRGMVVPAIVIGRTSERVVVDVWGTRVPVRGTGQSGDKRALCLRAENLALSANGSGIRGRVTGVAYHGAATLLTVKPDAPDAPELKVEHAGVAPEAGSAVTVEVRDGWIVPQTNGSESDGTKSRQA